MVACLSSARLGLSFHATERRENQDGFAKLYNRASADTTGVSPFADHVRTCTASTRKPECDWSCRTMEEVLDSSVSITSRDASSYVSTLSMP